MNRLYRIYMQATPFQVNSTSPYSCYGSLHLWIDYMYTGRICQALCNTLYWAI